MKTRNMYLRNSDNQHVGCLVTCLSEDKKSISYQVSSHNPLDQYSRIIGRNIATGRLATHPHIVELGTIEAKRHNILHLVLNDIVKNSLSHPTHNRDKSKFPVRIGEAAALWLQNHPGQPLTTCISQADGVGTDVV